MTQTPSEAAVRAAKRASKMPGLHYVQLEHPPAIEALARLIDEAFGADEVEMSDQMSLDNARRVHSQTATNKECMSKKETGCFQADIGAAIRERDRILTAATKAREQAENELAMMKASLSTPEGYVGVVTQELEDERDAWALKCKALTAANAGLVELLRECFDHLDGCSHGGTGDLYDKIEAVLAANPAGDKHDK